MAGEARRLEDRITDGTADEARISLQIDRLCEVLRVVGQHQFGASTNDVCRGVSSDFQKYSWRTIRRDLFFLEHRGLVERKTIRVDAFGGVDQIRWHRLQGELIGD